MTYRNSAAIGALIAITLAVPGRATAQSLSNAPADAAASSESVESSPQLLPISFSLSSHVDAAAAAAAPPPLPPDMPESTKQKWRDWYAMQSRAHKWEVAYLVLSAVDAAVTIECLERGKCTEVNPLLGKRPSPGEVILFKTGLGVAHYLLFRELNHRNPKAALRTAKFSVALQGAIVLWNMQVAF